MPAELFVPAEPSVPTVPHVPAELYVPVMSVERKHAYLRQLLKLKVLFLSKMCPMQFMQLCLYNLRPVLSDALGYVGNHKPGRRYASGAYLAGQQQHHCSSFAGSCNTLGGSKVGSTWHLFCVCTTGPALHMGMSIKLLCQLCDFASSSVT